MIQVSFFLVVHYSLPFKIASVVLGAHGKLLEGKDMVKSMLGEYFGGMSSEKNEREQCQIG